MDSQTNISFPLSINSTIPGNVISFNELDIEKVRDEALNLEEIDAGKFSIPKHCISSKLI